MKNIFTSTLSHFSLKKSLSSVIIHEVLFVNEFSQLVNCVSSYFWNIEPDLIFLSFQERHNKHVASRVCLPPLPLFIPANIFLKFIYEKINLSWSWPPLLFIFFIFFCLSRFLVILAPLSICRRCHCLRSLGVVNKLTIKSTLYLKYNLFSHKLILIVKKKTHTF